MTMNLSEQLSYARQSITADLDSALDKVFPGLVTNHQPNTVPEHVFSSYFLPGFLGQNPNRDWVAQWIGIAGSPTVEVAVVDNAGNELFRVPPILLSKDILFSRDRNAFGGIVQQSTNLQNSIYGKDRYLFSAMTAKESEIPVVSSMPQAVQRWTQILAMYGITTEQPPQPSATPESDMFDYD